MTKTIKARRDERLGATLVCTRPLLYGEGADDASDRPGFVRAASAAGWFGGRLAVIQDDAHFIGLVAPEGGAADVLTLPPGPGGLRRYDPTRGNKALKLDLEACVVLPDGRLIAFGSGSTTRREQLVVVEPDGAAALFDAHALYHALRTEIAFSGAELNVEGAALVGSTLRLFQRGNGAPRDGVPAVNASVDLALDAFLAMLQGSSPPALTHIRRYELGEIAQVPLGFTDAAAWPDGHILYLGGAEASPDAVADGEVVGACMGVITDEDVRWTPLVDPTGAPVILKAEGLALHPEDDRRAFVVTDMDDPDAPALIGEVHLTGPWHPATTRD